MKSDDNFIYLKLGQGNCLADYWLGKNNVYKEPVATIYFGNLGSKFIREVMESYKAGSKSKKDAINDLDKEIKSNQKIDKKQKIEGNEFNQIRTFYSAKEKRSKFVTFGNGKIYIYEPNSAMFDMEYDKLGQYDRDVVKLELEKEKRDNMRIYKNGDSQKIIHTPKHTKVTEPKEIDTRNVPHVLATLSSAQNYNRVTCRKIDDPGAIQAIKYCLRQGTDTPKSAEELLRLLSPYELETLVFLILKNKGLFVPAWRGGTLKEIDIIGQNKTEKKIELDNKVEFEKDSTKGFQVKKRGVKKPIDREDIFTVTVTFEGKKDKGKVLTADWLLKQVKSKDQSETRNWLANSLDWIVDDDTERMKRLIDKTPVN